MKKSIFTLGFAAFSIIACKKESGNQNIIKEENVETTVTNDNGIIDSTTSTSKIIKNGDQETQEHTYRYVAEDGSSANVTFTNSNDGNFISIKSNKKTIKVKQKEAWAKGAIYEENGIEVKSEGDNITITQGNNLIELRKAKGQ